MLAAALLGGLTTLLLAAPTSAMASTLSISGSTLFYSDSGAGAENTLQVSRQAGGTLFAFTDRVSITAAAPCLPGSNSRTATCPTTGIDTIVVYGGAGADTLDLSAETARATLLMGGAGNDVIKGGPGSDQLFGEDGDDTLDAGAGSDTVNGGPGADNIVGGADSDQLYCGEDAVVDTVSADSSDTVSADCTGDSVSVAQLPGAPAPSSSATPPPEAPPPSSPGTGTAAGAGDLAVLSPFPVVRLRGAVTRTGARIELLAVQAPRGSRVSVRCLGRSCPARRASAAAARGLRFKRFQRHLRAGVVLEVRVTRRGMVGKYVRFSIRKGKSPLRRDMCLRSTSGRPVRCSSV